MDLQLRRNQAFSYEDNVDPLIDRSITKATFQGTTIGDNAFRGCSQLESVNAPNCTGLSNYAFYGCTKLKNLNTATLTIDDGVLTTSGRTGIANYLFYGCNSITEINAQSLTSINQYAFSNCTGLTSVNIPNVTTLTAYVFQNCTSLTTIHAPKVHFLYGRSLSNIGAQYLVLPSARQTQSNAVLNSATLLGVDFGGTISGTGTNDKLNNYSFQGCTQLSTLVLRSPVMWPLNATNVFTNSPFASGNTGGTLYVPQDLIESYQAATNWRTILGYATNQILPIEESIYETQYVDGTPIST